MNTFNESHLEEACLEWLQSLGYHIKHGEEIKPESAGAERHDYRDVVLEGRLQAALSRINPRLPAEALDEAARKVLRSDAPELLQSNHRFHRLLTEGIPVSWRAAQGEEKHDLAWLVDYANPAANDLLAVNQYTVLDHGTRRPDIVVFINGLPLAVLELKNPADERATAKKAFGDLQIYKSEIPSLMAYNALLVASDGLQARAGSLTADWERFMPWRAIDGGAAPKGMTELEILVRGIFEPSRFLNLMAHFTVFEQDGPHLLKKIAAYHQFHAVNYAVERTVRASAPDGSRKVGVVWHTQGSGKSLTMVFYAAKIARCAEMKNPTLVLLTDRNDLDDQLFGTFCSCAELLRQTPVQAEDRADLRKLLNRESGGVIFTTLQKFGPSFTPGASTASEIEAPGEGGALSDRRNIIVIADEAHRSQYGFGARVVTVSGAGEPQFAYGFAKYLRDALPNASFIGFTGTPVELTDRSTTAVFGDLISTYDIQKAVEDGTTVRIFYEGRLARIELNEEERPYIDPNFEEVTEGEEQSVKEQLKRKWAQVEAMVGADKRISLIASDIVHHFEARQEAMAGKGMIVCMSRRICVGMYNALIKLCPQWNSMDDKQGFLKVVMTGSKADGLEWQQHIRSKQGREAIALRFKDPDDALQLVIVRDMWLTGFDVPCLHTMYLDKPMQGHGLMQAIARVNRVFRDKPGGLIIDYLGLADNLKQALSAYTDADRNETGIPQDEAANLLETKLEVVDAMLHGCDTSRFWTGTPTERLQVLLGAQDHILSLENGKRRYLQAVTELGRAFALAAPHERALAVRERVGFHQAVRNGLAKTLTEGEASPEDLNAAVRQIVSKSVTSNEVVDLFGAAGLENPEVSILSDEFLAEVQGMKHKNLALETLKKLLSDQIKTHQKTNLIQARRFSEMLQDAIKQLQNRSIDTVTVIAHLIQLAREMREAGQRGEEMGLSDDELAFYDALEVNDSAVKILGDDTLREIARELVKSVKANLSIDWNLKESARAKLRVIVKRILRKYGYPPDKTETATNTVLEQTELLCEKWG